MEEAILFPDGNRTQGAPEQLRDRQKENKCGT